MIVCKTERTIANYALRDAMGLHGIYGEVFFTIEMSYGCTAHA